jgi:hypothetical protein
MKQNFDPVFEGEPLDRLEQRALDGLTHGMAALRRLRRTLPRWIRPGDHVDAARAFAALLSVQKALRLISPCVLQQLARQIRARMTAQVQRQQEEGETPFYVEAPREPGEEG